MKTAASSEVIVIGAGIVGLCTAHALARTGRRVRLVDPELPGSQCSAGNSGALSAGSVAPLAMPGTLLGSLPMLFNPDGPLFIPPRYWVRAAPWLWQFARSAQPARVTQIADALQHLLARAVALHADMAQDVGCPSVIRQNGQLHLYPSDAALSADQGSWRLKAQHGLRIERVNQDDIRALEPAIRHAAYPVGCFLPDEGSVTEPLRYAQAIAASLAQRQVAFEQAAVSGMRHTPDGWQVYGAGQCWQAQHVIVAAGAWSARLLEPLGLNIPLQSQRGYHLQYPSQQNILTRVVVLADRKVFVNPMQTGLRIGGTVEIDAMERPARLARARRLETHLRAGLDLPAALEAPTIWMGHRPCLPDSMPVLGPVPDLPGLWCAFGHGHLGLTGSVNTGHWLAAAIAGRPPADMAAFSIRRFLA